MSSYTSLKDLLILSINKLRGRNLFLLFTGRLVRTFMSTTEGLQPNRPSKTFMNVRELPIASGLELVANIEVGLMITVV